MTEYTMFEFIDDFVEYKYISLLEVQEYILTLALPYPLAVHIWNASRLSSLAVHKLPKLLGILNQARSVPNNYDKKYSGV